MTDVFSGYSMMFDNSASVNTNSTGANQSLPVNSSNDGSYHYHSNYSIAGSINSACGMYPPTVPNTTSGSIGAVSPSSSNVYSQMSNKLTGGAANDDLNAMQSDLFEKRFETIHSGHFMVSEIDDGLEGEPLDQSVDDTESPISPVRTGVGDCELELPNQLVDDSMLMSEDQIVVENPCRAVACVRSASMIRIDNSLSKLFQCMSLAYESKLTSPKWKTFKGLKLKLRDKIRLNNMIWRAWHMQCKCSLINRFFVFHF